MNISSLSNCSLTNGYARDRCLIFIATIKKKTAYNFHKYCYIALHILRLFINYLPLELAFQLAILCQLL